MSKGLTEAERLKAAGDVYKLELLQQKLAEREWDLQKVQDRLAQLDQDNAGQALSMGLQPLSCELNCMCTTMC